MSLTKDIAQRLFLIRKQQGYAKFRDAALHITEELTQDETYDVALGVEALIDAEFQALQKATAPVNPVPKAELQNVESNLHQAIEDAFLDVEAELNYELDHHTRTSVVDGWTNILRAAALKFVKGGLEHNPTRDPNKHWLLVAFAKEQQAERIDLNHYAFGEDYLRKNPGVLREVEQMIAEYNKTH